MFGSMFNNSKYSNVLTVILVIAIIAIIVIVGFIGYNIYKKYHIEKGAAEAIAQFDNLVNNNPTDNSANNNVGINGIVEDTEMTTNSKTGQTTYKGYNVVSTIQIPKINLKYPIL